MTAITVAHPEHLSVAIAAIMSYALAGYLLFSKAKGAVWRKRKIFGFATLLGGLYGAFPRLALLFGVEPFFADLMIPFLLVGMPLFFLTMPVSLSGWGRFSISDVKARIALALGSALGIWSTFIASVILLAAPHTISG